MEIFSHIGLLFGRNIKRTLRNPVWVAFGLFQPILYMLFYMPLLESFGGTPGVPPELVSTAFVPGLMIMVAIFGSGFVGFALIDDLRSGVIDSYLVTPARRSAIIISMVLRDIFVLIAQAIILVIVAIPFGVTLHLGRVLATFGLMSLIAVAMASISYAVAIAVKKEDALASTLNTFMLPVFLLSGIMLPLTLGPEWLKNIASFNPFSYAVEAARVLFLGTPGNGAVIAEGFAFMALLAAFGIWLAVRAVKKLAA